MAVYILNIDDKDIRELVEEIKNKILTDGEMIIETSIENEKIIIKTKENKSTSCKKILLG